MDPMKIIASVLNIARSQQGPDALTQSLAAMSVSDRDEAEQAGRLEQWMAAWKKGEDAANTLIEERKKKEGF